MNSSDLGLIQTFNAVSFPPLLLPNPLILARCVWGSVAQGYTPLMGATNRGNGAAVTALVENNASVDLQDEHGNTPLYYASRNNQPSIVKCLVGVGADQSIKDNNGRTALDIATNRGYAEVVAILKNPEKVRAVRPTSPSLPLFLNITAV